jgi:succinate-semialdehyde dehydrogenase/glutarate-semialdehyde dehydrogenase
VDEITGIIHRDNGKLEIDALAAEVIPALIALKYYMKIGKKITSTRRISGGTLLMFNKRSSIISKPYGVIGIISPWNYPFAIPFSEALTALLAGNAVILKTASSTPETGRALEALFNAADMPDGLFSYVEMAGAEAGPAFIKGGVDKLFFTGSTGTGKELMSLAAGRLLPLVLELGGADAAIIRADADLDRAAAGIIWAGFSNAGQSCGGAQRILVHHAVYAPFMEKLIALVRALRTGSGRDCDIGPVISMRQKAAVKAQLDVCLAGGAKIAAQSAGSFDDESPFMPVVVLVNAPDSSPVMAGEIFGPVIALRPVADDAEAIAVANASSYSLTASIWSGNRRQARALAVRLNAGSVMINDHLMSHGLAETPWGGFGDSGLGRTHGEAGFREMLKTQVVIDDALPAAKRAIWWQPYSERVYFGLRAIAELLGGRSFLSRVKAAPAVVRIFFRYWSTRG